MNLRKPFFVVVCYRRIIEQLSRPSNGDISVMTRGPVHAYCLLVRVFVCPDASDGVVCGCEGLAVEIIGA